MRPAHLTLLFIAANLVITGFAQESAPTPQQLVERSRKVSDLTEIGPYRLQAEVILAPGTRNELKGQITVFRDKDRFRSELQIRDFHESRWINNSTLYIGRSQPVPVPRITLLRQLDRVWRASAIPSDAAIKTSARKQQGRNLECVEISRKNSPTQKLCFDSSTSSLITRSGFEFHDVEFQDFGTIGEKFFPHKIIFRNDDGIVMEVRDISVATTTLAPDTFLPPDGASGFATCDEPIAPRKVKDVAPAIPLAIRQLHAGDVYLYGLVGTTGSLQNISVEYSPHSAFTASAVDAVKQWQYDPASCGDKAVPSEVEIFVRYFTRIGP